MEVNYSDSLKGYVLLRMSNTIAQFPDGYIADVKIIKNKSRDNFSHNTHYELNEVDVICGVGIKELAEKDYKILKEKIKEI